MTNQVASKAREFEAEGRHPLLAGDPVAPAKPRQTRLRGMSRSRPVSTLMPKPMLIELAMEESRRMLSGV